MPSGRNYSALEKHWEWAKITIMGPCFSFGRKLISQLRSLSLILPALILISAPLTADEKRDKYDFDPPPPEEKPLSSYLPEASDRQTELFVSGLGVAGGLSLSLIAAGSAVSSGFENPSNGELQRDLALTGFGLIGTAVFAVFFDYYLEQHRKKAEDLTSEE